MNVAGSQVVEQRSVKRWHLLLYLRVFDSDDRLVGHLVDISTAGMMLISEHPVAVGEDFDLWLELPKDGEQRERLEIRARSIRCDPDVNPCFHDTGFSFLGESRYTVERVSQLIQDLRIGE